MAAALVRTPLGFPIPAAKDKAYPPRPMSTAIKLALGLSSALGLAGIAGLSHSSLSRQAAGFLALTFAGIASGLGVLWMRVKSVGAATYMPPVVHPVLFELTPVELAMGLALSVDWDAMVAFWTELGPIFLARNAEEAKRVVANMGAPLQGFFQGKGLVSLLPWHVQQVLLPPELVEQRRAIYGELAMVETKPANLPAQMLLAQELLAERVAEAARAMEEHSRAARILIALVKQLIWLRQQIKASSWAEIQVYCIVVVLLFMSSRALFRAVFVLVRFGLGEVVRLLE